MKENQPFEIAHISDDLHGKLKQVEEEFEQKLGKRIALVAYEKSETDFS